ncbi:hypothetical protein FQN50_002261 [Emmonsiellopsis sp. PD_5]|nr:hypothetical protein FQN50_002261 [Emmonsiellopsis sp. PD_5]
MVKFISVRAAIYGIAILRSTLTHASAIPTYSKPKQQEQLDLRLITFNIRYAAKPSGNEKAWPDRRGNLITQVAFETGSVDNAFVGMQEVLSEQLEDIITGLNEHPSSGGRDWTYIGVGRDDGKSEGEFSPILYRESVWELLEFGTKWLSETPDVPSFGWGASNRRIVTIGVFKHRKSEKLLLALNTHLDDQVSAARLHGTELILRLIDEYKKNDKYEGRIAGVTLTGDFNSEEDQEAYMTISNSTAVFDPVKSFPNKYIYGNRKTFTGFDSEVGLTRIDYVFLGHGNSCGKEEWNVKGYAVLPNKFDDGIFFSDHRAVVADGFI